MSESIVDDFEAIAGRLKELEREKAPAPPGCFVCHDVGFVIAPGAIFTICPNCLNRLGNPEPTIWGTVGG